MSAPVNPILVIQNNLPEYKAELVEERERLMARLDIIDVELRTIERLIVALDPPVADAVGDPQC